MLSEWTSAAFGAFLATFGGVATYWGVEWSRRRGQRVSRSQWELLRRIRNAELTDDRKRCDSAREGRMHHPELYRLAESEGGPRVEISHFRPYPHSSASRREIRRGASDAMALLRKGHITLGGDREGGAEMRVTPSGVQAYHRGDAGIDGRYTFWSWVIDFATRWD